MYRGKIRRTRIHANVQYTRFSSCLKSEHPRVKELKVCATNIIFLILIPPIDLLLRIGAGFVQLIAESETIVVRLPEATATTTTMATLQHVVIVWDRWPRLVCLLQRQELRDTYHA